MELKIVPATLPTSPTFNYSEVLAMVQEKAELYSHTVYDESQISAAKADKAALNRLAKALNDERIKQEKTYMEPFNAFKAQVNEIIGVIKPAVAAIDKQVKQYDEKRKEAKLDEIKEFWAALDIPYPVQLEQIMDAKWLNSSTSMAAVEKAIIAKLDAIMTDVTTLRRLPEFAFEAENVYMSTLDIRKALSAADRLTELAKLKAQREKTAIAPAAPAEVTPEPTEADKPEATRYWLSFKANLTLDDARALKVFFEQRGIEFEAIH